MRENRHGQPPREQMSLEELKHERDALNEQIAQRAEQQTDELRREATT